MSAAPDPVERFLATHLEFRPVDASFMGEPGHDHRLPPAGPEADARELDAWQVLERELAAFQPGPSAAARHDARMALAQARLAILELESRPRGLNPAWYTGEAAFGLVSLLLPSDPPRLVSDLRERLEAIPAFLAAGTTRLAGQAVPADWAVRARNEAQALALLLERGLPRHPLWSGDLERPAAAAARAAAAFAAGLDGLPDADPACGEAHLEFLVREVHGLPHSLARAEALALEGFERARAELATLAAQLDPSRTAAEQIGALELEHPPLEGVLAAYEAWNARALAAADAAGLVTPAADYGLRFRSLPDWAREAAPALYFLFYRSPPAGRPSDGSTYWVFEPGDDPAAYLRGQSTATIKITHVVHHGSIGHHTQNARARASSSRLGRLAGTDCASGIAMLGGGTMVEGWACHVQDLMIEADDFYAPAERLLLRQHELRNAATCLGDLRLHRGAWSLEELRRFYAEQAGLAPARIWSETTRNSMFPGSRLMYWLGTREIRELRRDSRLDARELHDRLLAFGSVPVTWAADELRPSRPARSLEA